MEKRIDQLISAKNSLKTTLEKSNTLALSLDNARPRLDEINRGLPSLAVAFQPIRAPVDALEAVGRHISRAIVPAASVLRVFDAIHGLEKSLANPLPSLRGYLGVIKQLCEALRFLEANIGVAIQWLADIVDYLEVEKVADERFISGLKNALICLQELAAGEENGRLDGGLLEVAFDRLENEFRRLLVESSLPLSMSLAAEGGRQAIARSPLPVTVIKKLHAIIGRLIVCNRLDLCLSIYVGVRSSNLKASLGMLNLDYLEMSVSEFNDVGDVEGYISKWGKQLEFTVKHLLEDEYNLCKDVFERIGIDVWRDCFAKIASQAGILSFLQFGKTVTESKKDPIKLLKCLDIFASLNNLRLDFNRLFGGPACADIQTRTRDLVKRIVLGACEIFWELSTQVELQRHTPPPSDGSIPRVVIFITDYCNKLLGDDYKPILTQVLVIERSWKHEKFNERVLIDELLGLVKTITTNLETWSKGYEDPILPCFFLMNNHWHLYKSLKHTKLGIFLGDSWLKDRERQTEYYSTIYLRESWGKLPSLMSREGLILFSGSRATARDLVKKRLKSFNTAFDDMYRKHSNWVILDRDLREKTRQAIIQTTVPVYRSYMQNYGPLVEQDVSESKYAKYTVQSLETMLGGLFNPRPVRHGSLKSRQSTVKFGNGVSV